MTTSLEITPPRPVAAVEFETVACGRPYSVRLQDDGTYLVEYLASKDSAPFFGPRGLRVAEIVLETAARTQEELAAEIDEKITKMEALPSPRSHNPTKGGEA